MGKTSEPFWRDYGVLWVTFCLLVCGFGLSEGSKTRHFHWNVEYFFWSPDCIENVVMGINGQFPGPTIRAAVGDTVVVHLTNKLPTEGVVIHWHGIRQFGTPWSDGTASISQCAINPGETFNYTFNVEQAGTFFYHGHFGMQRMAGLYGSLIVDVAEEAGLKEPFHYDGELNLLLSDWWHESIHTLEVGLSSVPTRWIGDPQSLLINGRGQFNCSLDEYLVVSPRVSKQCKFKGDEQCAPSILPVSPNKVYRLRIASTTSYASLNIAIQNHTMLVVEADANYVQPFTTSSIDIHSGETYSVLITTNQNPSENYWVSAAVTGQELKTPKALTLLNYLPTPATKLPSSPPPVPPQWDDFDRLKNFTFKITAATGSPKPPRKYDRRMFFLNTQHKNKGVQKWAINNVSLTLPTTPYLGAIKYGLNQSFDQSAPPETYPADYDIDSPPANPATTVSNAIYRLELNSTVDIILQNANTLTKNRSEIHPWHLHAHDFWVLGYGEGKFLPGFEKKLNLENPPLKNTVVIFPYGWTAVRFVADNPGAWIFHCHIEPHLHMGMGVIFAEGVEDVGQIPKSALACGLTGEMLMAAAP